MTQAAVPQFTQSLKCDTSYTQHSAANVESPSCRRAVRHIHLHRKSTLPMMTRRIKSLPRNFTRRTRTQRMRRTRIIQTVPIRHTTITSRSILIVRRIRHRLLIQISIRTFSISLQRSMRHNLQLSNNSTKSLIRRIMSRITLIIRTTTQRSMIISTLITTRHNLRRKLNKRIQARTRINRRIRTLSMILNGTLITKRSRPTSTMTNSRIQFQRTKRNRTRRIQNRQNSKSILRTIRSRTVMSFIKRSSRLIFTHSISSLLRRFL